MKLEVLNRDQTSPEGQELYDQLKKKIGQVPNIYAAMLNSPAALKGMLTFGEILDKGEFSKKEGEALALFISQKNDCQYCLGAHSVIGKMNGFSDEEILDLRKNTIADPKLKALLDLADEIIKTNGYPKEELVQAFADAGYSKAALVELIAYIALNYLRNLFNHVADTPMDFPKAPALK